MATRRVPRPTTTNVRFGGGRKWPGDLQRLKRRIDAGRPIKLYRGQRVSPTGDLRPRLLRSVAKNQSWTTSPHLALEFVDMTGTQRGRAGLLYSITVPAVEFRHLSNITQPGYSRSFERQAQPPAARHGEWSMMADVGRLEFRPNRDRGDLKPKIVGSTVSLGRSSRVQEFGFTRRLQRARPAVGGGA